MSNYRKRYDPANFRHCDNAEIAAVEKQFFLYRDELAANATFLDGTLGTQVTLARKHISAKYQLLTISRFALIVEQAMTINHQLETRIRILLDHPLIKRTSDEIRCIDRLIEMKAELQTTNRSIVFRIAAFIKSIQRTNEDYDTSSWLQAILDQNFPKPSAN